MAANGSIEWMCLPRFDSASIFGALLDRTAGAMRFAPDERVPVARRYEPGTNVIETTWATETGWVDRPRRPARQRRAQPRRAQPARGRAHARPLRPLPGGPRRDRARLRGTARLRARRHRMGPRRRARRRDRHGRRHPAAVPGRHGSRGRRRRAPLGRPPARHRRERLLRLDLVRRGAAARARRRGRQAGLRDRAGLAAVARARQVPRPPLARRAAALGADPEGAHAADRRHGRGADDVAARVAGRGAQLGLPLHVDPRRDLHALGAPRARPRRRGPATSWTSSSG